MGLTYVEDGQTHIVVSGPEHTLMEFPYRVKSSAVLDAHNNVVQDPVFYQGFFAAVRFTSGMYQIFRNAKLPEELSIRDPYNPDVELAR